MTRALIMHVIICMHVPELSTSYLTKHTLRVIYVHCARVQFICAHCTVLCERMSFDVEKVVAIQSSVRHWLGQRQRQASCSGHHCYMHYRSAPHHLG